MDRHGQAREKLPDLVSAGSAVTRPGCALQRRSAVSPDTLNARCWAPSRGTMKLYILRLRIRSMRRTMSSAMPCGWNMYGGALRQDIK